MDELLGTGAQPERGRAPGHRVPLYVPGVLLPKLDCGSRRDQATEFSALTHTCSSTYKFTIDIRPIPWYPFSCYLEQSSLLTPVTPLESALTSILPASPLESAFT